MLLLAALLAGCAAQAAEPAEPTPAAYFRVYDVSTEDASQYRYFVYTRGGDLLANGVTARQPEFSFPDIEKWPGLIKLRVFEFGASGDSCRYFDIDGGRASGWFWYPVGENDGMVVCVDQPAFATKLIVQSIFNDDYYREFEMDFAKGWGDVYRMEQQDPVVSAVFSDDGTQLVVTYLYLDEEEYVRQKTVTLKLD
ncbi:MAG: hypothetical protein AAGU77_09825 [Bacillota bacterium]